MTTYDVFAGQDETARATKDIHARCGAGFDVLWDNGKFPVAMRIHKVKIWNGLGSVELKVTHDDLVERGATYWSFIDQVASAVKQRLTVGV